MTNDDEIMTAEEFFGEIDNADTRPSRTCRPLGRKSEKDFFAKTKVKMVMRVYAVSRARALMIIAEREAEKGSPEDGMKRTGEKSGHADGTLVSADEFFA